MTIEETAEYFKEMTESYGAYELCPCFSDHMEMAEIAFSALEKQIPKKVVPVPKPCKTSFACPDCKKKVYKTQKYCDRCGQALDWSDTE